jgi:hypothetical protein
MFTPVEPEPPFAPLDPVLPPLSAARGLCGAA